jgi:tRNA nucleotidyltransferase/poly(A) polymerase
MLKEAKTVSKEMVEKSLNHLDELERYYKSVQDVVASPKPLLDGKEIMSLLNLKPSKIIGEIIEELIEMQLASEIKTKDEAIKYVLNRK